MLSRIARPFGLEIVRYTPGQRERLRNRRHLRYKDLVVEEALAMTGEITLRGKVLPVGGIKEKILAAKRARIKEILLCEENRRDIEEIKPEYVKGLTFHYVSDMSDVIKIAITNQKVQNAKNL